MTGYYKIETYVPTTHAAEVRAALAAAGAGKLGHYDSCVWETTGTGRFRPLAGSHPVRGSVGDVEAVEEVKLETICPADRLDAVISALKQAHPYETPAIYVMETKVL